MNFDEAIQAHGKWKLNLLNYIEKGAGQLDSSVIGSDRCCTLGKWIYGDGMAHKSSPHFSAMVASHARFHKCAALIVGKINSGVYVPRSEIINESSPFAIASYNVIKYLRLMKSTYRKKAG